MREQQYEHNDVDSTASGISGANWIAQTFTPETTHRQTKVVLKIASMYHVGHTYDMTGPFIVSIRATDGEGKPTGADLVSKSLIGEEVGNGLISFYFDNYQFREKDVKYAIVIRYLRTTDHKDMTICRSEAHVFGNETQGVAMSYIAQNATTNNIKGTAYTCPYDGIAKSLSAYLWRDSMQYHDETFKAALINHTDLSVVGVTEERTINMRNIPILYTFNFPDPKPVLVAGTEYIPVFWGSYDGTAATMISATGSLPSGSGHYQNKVYDGTFPNPYDPSHSTTEYHGYCSLEADVYTRGQCATSDDSGATWTLQDYDLRFEEWGFTGDLEVEPKVVSITTSYFATRMPIQRKSLWAVGRFWNFYSSDPGGEVRLRTSVDGVYFSEPTTIGVSFGGADFSVWLEGTDLLHYCHGYHDDSFGCVPFAYRTGTLKSDGTITWKAAAQLLGGYCADTVIAVDSLGYPWIAFVDDCFITAGKCYITKSSVKDGTWVTAGGFPLLVKDAVDYNIIIVPLTDGKMFMTYAKLYGATSKLLGKLWNGAALGSEETLSTTKVDTTMMGRFSSVSFGDIVHTVFLAESTYQIIHVIRYADGSTEEKVVCEATSNYTSPVLTVDEATGDLYCSYAMSNHIYRKKYDAFTGTWDAIAKEWINETSETLSRSDRLVGFYKVFGNRIGVLYHTKGAIPYNVKFDWYMPKYPIEGKEFITLMDAFKRGFGGNPSFDVTLSSLSLGDRDSVTGWYAKNYVDSTVKMILIQKESQNLALKMGYWVSLDALGLTIVPINVYDLVTDKFKRTWEVKAVKPIIVGDTVKYFVCDLKELPLHG